MPPRESHKQPYYMAARRYSWAVRQKQSSAVHTYVRRATASATAAAAAAMMTAAVTGKLWSPRSFTCEMQLSSSHLNWKRASTAIWVATCARASVTGTSTTWRCIAVLLTPLPPPPPRRRASNRKEGSATLTIAKYTVSCVHHNNLAFACSIACTVYGFFYE